MQKRQPFKKKESSQTSSRPRVGARGKPQPKSQRFVDIVYEDRDLLVLNKPAGVLAEPKSDSPSPDILKMARQYLQRKFKEAGGSYLQLIHRLDRDTSGLIVLAKSKAGEKLSDLFRRGEINRQYLAIVEGAVEKSEGKIDLPLEKGEFSHGRKVKVSETGKPSLTFYRVIERYEKATVLGIETATGRTHQIRVHLAEIGHPLIGDKIYGATKIKFPRQALHATVLSFRHPGTGKKVRFESKPGGDLETLIDRLRSFEL
ncbi:MAG: RluA family pseudouridine synthase [Deltaproteobacteria bacterium]|nr:RluA family pseudouridine synthase [Deltaproteobacteria bacterium]